MLEKDIESMFHWRKTTVRNLNCGTEPNESLRRHNKHGLVQYSRTRGTGTGTDTTMNPQTGQSVDKRQL